MMTTRHTASTSTRWRFAFGAMLSCAPIANPPNSAQLGSTSYHSFKLHPGLCSSLGIRRWTDTQSDTQTAVTAIHSVSSTTHAKCMSKCNKTKNIKNKFLDPWSFSETGGATHFKIGVYSEFYSLRMTEYPQRAVFSYNVKVVTYRKWCTMETVLLIRPLIGSHIRSVERRHFRWRSGSFVYYKPFQMQSLFFEKFCSN